MKDPENVIFHILERVLPTASRAQIRTLIEALRALARESK